MTKDERFIQDLKDIEERFDYRLRCAVCYPERPAGLQIETARGLALEIMTSLLEALVAHEGDR